MFLSHAPPVSQTVVATPKTAAETLAVPITCFPCEPLPMPLLRFHANSRQRKYLERSNQVTSERSAGYDPRGHRHSGRQRHSSISATLRIVSDVAMALVDEGRLVSCWGCWREGMVLGRELLLGFSCLGLLCLNENVSGLGLL